MTSVSKMDMAPPFRSMRNDLRESRDGARTGVDEASERCEAREDRYDEHPVRRLVPSAVAEDVRQKNQPVAEDRGECAPNEILQCVEEQRKVRLLRRRLLEEMPEKGEKGQ